MGDHLSSGLGGGGALPVDMREAVPMGMKDEIVRLLFLFVVRTLGEWLDGLCQLEMRGRTQL